MSSAAVPGSVLARSKAKCRYQARSGLQGPVRTHPYLSTCVVLVVGQPGAGVALTGNAAGTVWNVLRVSGSILGGKGLSAATAAGAVVVTMAS